MNTFFTECLFYLLFGGMAQALCALFILPIYFLIGRRLTNCSYADLSRAFLIFNAFLLLWGCLGHFVFHLITFDRLYVSVDRAVDWFPFIPFGQWVLDQAFDDHRGHLIGDATLWQLRLIWLAVAAPVWLLTYASTVSAWRFRFPPAPRLTHANL